MKGRRFLNWLRWASVIVPLIGLTAMAASFALRINPVCASPTSHLVKDSLLGNIIGFLLSILSLPAWVGFFYIGTEIGAAGAQLVFYLAVGITIQRIFRRSCTERPSGARDNLPR